MQQQRPHNLILPQKTTEQHKATAATHHHNSLSRSHRKLNTYMLLMSGNGSARRRLPHNSICAEGLFPGKLHDMLDFSESHGMQNIISWTSNGRAFMIHDPEKLVDILPLFFSQTKYRSFHRQLNMWSFERINKHGANRGAFHHPYFIRGGKSACQHMSREIFKTHPFSNSSPEDRFPPKSLVSSNTLTVATPRIEKEVGKGTSGSSGLASLNIPESLTESTIESFVSKPHGNGMAGSTTKAITGEQRIGFDGLPLSPSQSLIESTIALFGSASASETSQSRFDAQSCQSDLQCHSNSCISLQAFVGCDNVALDGQNLGSSQRFIESTIKTFGATPVSESSCRNRISSQHRPSGPQCNNTAGITKQAFEVDVQGEFEGRPFFFVDMENSATSKQSGFESDV